MRDPLFLLILMGLAVVALASHPALADEEDAVTAHPFLPLFRKWASTYRVPWRWLMALSIVESSEGKNRAVARGLADPTDVAGSTSSDGKSWGLEQLTVATASALEGRPVSPVELNDPDESVKLAAQLLRELIDRFGLEDPESVFRAYNGGPGFGAATYPYWLKISAALAQVQAEFPGDQLET